MTAEILTLLTLRTRCDHCGKPMRKHVLSNHPAYCTYECGCAAQPDHSMVQDDNYGLKS